MKQIKISRIEISDKGITAHFEPDEYLWFKSKTYPNAYNGYEQLAAELKGLNHSKYLTMFLGDHKE